MPLRRRGPACTINTVDDAELLGEIETRQLLLSGPTGWAKVDAIVRDIAANVAQGKSEHDYQGVGHLCREALIALADAVHNPTLHPPTDDKTPSKTDAKRRLDAYLAVELPGNANDEARRMAKAAVDLANAVQHRQGATLRDAALAAEATNGVVNVVAIIAGRRDKPLESIREELAERVARAEAETGRWRQKYEALAGFSASLTLEGHGAPGTQVLRIVATQDVQAVAVDYCLTGGVRFHTENLPAALSGRDVRVPINHSCVAATFWQGFRTHGVRGNRVEALDIVLRVRLRVSDLLREQQITARVEHEVGSSEVRLIG